MQRCDFRYTYLKSVKDEIARPKPDLAYIDRKISFVMKHLDPADNCYCGHCGVEICDFCAGVR